MLRDSGAGRRIWWRRKWTADKAGLHTLLPPWFLFGVTVWTSVVVVIETFIAPVGRVVEQHAARAGPDCLDQVNGKVGVVGKALAIRLDIALVARIHDLARGDACDQSTKGRARRARAVDGVNLVGIGDQLSLVEALSVLVHGHVLQLRHVEALAEHVELVAAHGIVVLLVVVNHVRDIVQGALVEPLDEQLEAGGVVVGQVEAVLPGAAVCVAQQLVLQRLGVVAQEVAVQGPVAPGRAYVDVDHGSRKQSIALQLSFCSYMQMLGEQAMRQGGAHGDALGGRLVVMRRRALRLVVVFRLPRACLIAGGGEKRIVYVLSKGRGGHMANATRSHSRPSGTGDGEITVVDSWNLPHTAGGWRS